MSEGDASKHPGRLVLLFLVAAISSLTFDGSVFAYQSATPVVAPGAFGATLTLGRNVISLSPTHVRKLALVPGCKPKKAVPVGNGLTVSTCTANTYFNPRLSCADGPTINPKSESSTAVIRFNTVPASALVWTYRHNANPSYVEAHPRRFGAAQGPGKVPETLRLPLNAPSLISVAVAYYAPYPSVDTMPQSFKGEYSRTEYFTFCADATPGAPGWLSFPVPQHPMTLELPESWVTSVPANGQAFNAFNKQGNVEATVATYSYTGPPAKVFEILGAAARRNLLARDPKAVARSRMVKLPAGEALEFIGELAEHSNSGTTHKRIQGYFLVQNHIVYDIEYVGTTSDASVDLSIFDESAQTIRFTH